MDGHDLEPYEAATNALLHQVRRVVVDAAGVVIDLGRARLFTGSARHAVKLSATTCVWAGCTVPVSRCEIDHLTDYAHGGQTCPEEGAPLCGKHNRWKQKRFIIRRNPDGTYRTLRPNGTPLP